MARRAKSILAVSNLRVQRGPTLILDDIFWTVDRREHWAILGANGSGKTSLNRHAGRYTLRVAPDARIM